MAFEVSQGFQTDATGFLSGFIRVCLKKPFGGFGGPLKGYRSSQTLGRVLARHMMNRVPVGDMRLVAFQIAALA